MKFTPTNAAVMGKKICRIRRKAFRPVDNAINEPPPHKARRVVSTEGGLRIDGRARVLRADGSPLPNPLAGGGVNPAYRNRRVGISADDGIALVQIAGSAGYCVAGYLTELINCVPKPLFWSFCRVEIPVTPQQQQGGGSADEDERRQIQHEMIIVMNIEITPKY